MSDDLMVKIEWRLLQMMAERRIKKNTDMANRMREVGVDISTHQVGRLVNEFPKLLNTEYLRGLITVLDCGVEDLIRIHPADSKNFIEGNNSVHPTPPKAKPFGRPLKKASTSPQEQAPLQSSALPDGVDDYLND